MQLLRSYFAVPAPYLLQHNVETLHAWRVAAKAAIHATEGKCGLTNVQKKERQTIPHCRDVGPRHGGPKVGAGNRNDFSTLRGQLGQGCHRVRRRHQASVGQHKLHPHASDGWSSIAGNRRLRRLVADGQHPADVGACPGGGRAVYLSMGDNNYTTCGRKLCNPAIRAVVEPCKGGTGSIQLRSGTTLARNIQVCRASNQVRHGPLET